MKQVQVAVSVIILVLAGAFAQAQQIVATNTNVGVPPLVNFSGALTDPNGKPLTGAVAVTFSLFSEQTGGAALWMETQNIQPDSAGHYTVMLGSTSSSGLPADIFVAGEAHWLAVQVQGQQQEEQPRILLVSAPYALKAGDAQTLGGLPASAYVLAAPPSGVASSTAPAIAAATQNAPPPDSAITGTGTVNFIPLWDSTSDIDSSAIFQSGSGATAKIGIGTSAPASTLDIKGGSTVRGTLSLPATGTATAAAGKNSQPLDLAASVFNSTSSAAIAQTFQWQAEPAGNDTSTASGTLNLLFGSGTTKPAETGLHIANDGQITFATGQTFPGTGDGTITGVTTASGSGLTGGGMTGSLNLGLTTTCAANQVLQWNGSVWVCSSAGTGTITGVTAGTGLSGGGTSGGVTLTNTGILGLTSGTGVTVGSGQTPTIGINTSVVPQLSANNTFTGTQTINNTTIMTGNNSDGVLQVTNTVTSGYGAAIIATTDSTGANGLKGVVNASSGTGAGLYGQTSSPSGFGVEGTSSFVGVYGQVNGQSVLGSEEGGWAGVWGDTGDNSGIREGVLGTADYDSAGYFLNSSSVCCTLQVTNLGNPGETCGGCDGTGAPPLVFATSGGSTHPGHCTINVRGDVGCTGRLGTDAPVDGGARKVSLYAMQSPENWFEDFGSGTLANGVTTIALDPTFAQTVSTTAEYHVFLTPKGDSAGLYVSNETPQGFEVHEQRGGHSNVAFDYRIVAKRKGYEKVRLADVTEQYQKMEQQEQLRQQQVAQHRAARSAAGPVAAAAIGPRK